MGGACPPPGPSSALVAPAAAHFRPPKKACLATPGDEVFSGNPCMETRQGLGRTLSRTWQPGPPCLRRLATAGRLRTLWAGGPSCSPVDTCLQEVNRARLPDPSVAPGLRPILPSRAVLSCGQLPAGVTSLQHPLSHFQDAEPLCGRPGDPADPETLGEGNTAGPSFHVFSAWLGGAALKGDIVPVSRSPAASLQWLSLVIKDWGPLGVLLCVCTEISSIFWRSPHPHAHGPSTPRAPRQSPKQPQSSEVQGKTAS